MSNTALVEMSETIVGVLLDSGMADDAVYMPAAGGASRACRVLVDRRVQDFGFESRVANPMVTLTTLVAEVGTPRRGDTFVVGADQFLVDSAPLEADEAIVVVAVKQVTP